MKVSLITVVYNGEAFIESAIQSVLAQDYPDIEYIIVDGASKDGTMTIVEKYRDRIATVISEPDKGIYDAMNKGVRAATGDVIGILNADDFYAANDVISDVVKLMKEKQVDTIFGDLVYVQPENLEKVVRFYSAKNFKIKDFEKGDMPPHPTFFVKRALYDQFGLFKTDYKIAADFEIMVRMLYKGGASWAYLHKVMTKMRVGGVSTAGLKSKVDLNREIKRACDENGLKTSMAKIYSKYFSKVMQLVKRPS